MLSALTGCSPTRLCLLERGKRELLIPAAPEFMGLAVFHLAIPGPKAWIKSVGFLLPTFTLEVGGFLFMAASSVDCGLSQP